MKITWIKLADQSYKGFDCYGNEFRQPANQETTTVTLADGRTGFGWSEEEAFAIANKKPLPSTEVIESTVVFFINLYNTKSGTYRNRSVAEMDNPDLAVIAKKLSIFELQLLINVMLDK